MTVGIQDMSSNYPKGIRAAPDGVTIELYPGTEQFDGYIFTGDRTYIEFPLALVMKRIKSANFGVFGEGAFAYDARGILFYLEYADMAGILKDLPPY